MIWLRRVEELSQKEVAVRLGISEKTVEKHVAKGMRLLADHFHGDDGARAPAAPRRARAQDGQQAD
ncbi:sigma factor-like helix-turn-helix DNA-binding protein [Xanthomonas hyacinthi]|uniref:sigma factor-like helix-turn-helix DNA-binding protein n=1 Tax=Xanthomonas hyacinthi TaxID=56455 RepID=UPI000A9D2B20|nr:sigma factor-like helix-turn-helix DNA-binding protein [Xanthomonas hyacinthi]